MLQRASRRFSHSGFKLDPSLPWRPFPCLGQVGKDIGSYIPFIELDRITEDLNWTTKGTSEKGGKADPIKTNKKSKVAGTDATEKINTPSLDATVNDSKTEGLNKLKKPRLQIVNNEGYWSEIRSLLKELPRWAIKGTIAALASSFLWYAWKEDLYLKAQLEWATQDPRQIEHMILDEWSGLKNDVPIKVHGRVTALPQWDWMWFLGTLPGTLFSLTPLRKLTKNYETLQRQSHAAITPIDFSPTIEKVLTFAPSQFIILDGQQGTGKSTAMLLLCWHEIKQGNSAMFLHMNELEQRECDDFCITKYIKKNPSWIQHLATIYALQRSTFTIVVDDMYKYLQNTQTRQNATVIIGYLWHATKLYGTRVVFPTSDYGLEQAIVDLPMHHSARFQQVRMYAPAETELAETINRGIRGKGHENVEGNTPVDIARYCEVVGTLRELRVNCLTPGETPCSSVRQATQVVFRKTMEALPKILRTVMLMQDKKMQACDFESDYVPYTRKDVKETLCRNQYIDPEGDTLRAACEALASANILRPVYDLSGRYEFHSFHMEVAIRAVFDLPTTLKSSIPRPGSPESNGRGTRDTIRALKSGMEHFKMTKADVDRALYTFEHNEEHTSDVSCQHPHSHNYSHN